jgi:hypothetical protein
MKGFRASRCSTFVTQAFYDKTKLFFRIWFFHSKFFHRNVHWTCPWQPCPASLHREHVWNNCGAGSNPAGVLSGHINIPWPSLSCVVRFPFIEYFFLQFSSRLEGFLCASSLSVENICHVWRHTYVECSRWHAFAECSRGHTYVEI